MTENKTDDIIPNQSFFGSIGKDNKDKKEQKPEEFIKKGSNRKITEPYDIHFMIGSAFFSNLVEFTSEVGYDVVLWFKKKEMKLVMIDASQTHGLSISFDKIEFADYSVNGLENDDSEKLVYIDLSIISEDLLINENYPIDFYIDTVQNNRFYVVCGKEMVRKQLESVSLGDDSVLTTRKKFDNSIHRIAENSGYQKVVVNMNSMNGLIKSLNKKKSKVKEKSTYLFIYSRRGELDFIIENEVKGSSYVLSGEDMLVSPINECKIELVLEFLTKMSKLKLTYNPTFYIGANLPIMVETRLGGSKIILCYLIAPRDSGN